jgi:uncharacterized OsmC-like protein
MIRGISWHHSRNQTIRERGWMPTQQKMNSTINNEKIMTTMTAIETMDIIRNGVNVTKLSQTIEAVKQQPEIAAFKFRARNKWDTGGHNVATVDAFYGTCQEMEHKQPFVMHADEPPVLLGEDNGANPVEYVLAGLSGCMTTTLAYHAAGRGLNIEEISSEFEGDIDLQGMLDLDPKVRSGYREIRVKFKVKGDLDEMTAMELVRKSPVYDTLANPVKIRIEIEKV